MGKKIVLLPQTYGPYSQKIARALAKFIFNHAALIFSRDKEGLQVIKKMLGKESMSRKAFFCPDVAFTLITKEVKEPETSPPIREKESCQLIGINVNGLMYNGGYTRDNMFGLKCDYSEFIKLLIENLLNQTSANVVLLPHTFGVTGNINSDLDACRDVLQSFNEKWNDRLYMVNKEYDQSELKGIVRLCNFFIGSRMHSCIAALSQGIPTIAIAYSKKFIGVFESVGLGEFVIDIRSLDTEIALHTVTDKFNNYSTLPKNHIKNVHLAKDRINNVFNNLFRIDNEEYDNYSV